MVLLDSFPLYLQKTKDYESAKATWAWHRKRSCILVQNFTSVNGDLINVTKFSKSSTPAHGDRRVISKELAEDLSCEAEGRASANGISTLLRGNSEWFPLLIYDTGIPLSRGKLGSISIC